MSIELPRKLEDYFAYAEIESTPTARRFSITLPYFDGTRMNRLQWWWQITAQQEDLSGERAIAEARAKATMRFARHIERWLINTNSRLHGHEVIPRVSALERSPCITAEAQPSTGEDVLSPLHAKAASNWRR